MIIEWLELSSLNKVYRFFALFSYYLVKLNILKNYSLKVAKSSNMIAKLASQGLIKEIKEVVVKETPVKNSDSSKIESFNILKDSELQLRCHCTTFQFSNITTCCDYYHTFGHLMEISRLLRSELVLHGWGIFDKPGVLWSATCIMFIYRHGQGFRQEPERNGRHESDGTSDKVAQPPCPHPAGITRGKSHRLCEERKNKKTLVQYVDSFSLICFSFTMVTLSVLQQGKVINKV